MKQHSPSDQLRKELLRISSGYKKNPRYLPPGSKRVFVDNIFTVYEAFLDGNQDVKKVILELGVRILEEEIDELIKGLNGFIDEFKDVMANLEGMRVVTNVNRPFMYLVKG